MKGAAKLALGLLIVGAALVVVGLISGLYDAGSCPATSVSIACDHTMTVGGLTFWIAATSNEILAVGSFALVSGMVFGAYANKRPKQNDQSHGLEANDKDSRKS